MENINRKERKLFEELKPIVNPLGVTLLDVEYKTHTDTPLLRVVVTSEDGVTLKECGKISDQVSPVLDLMELDIKGPYDLEVTSPGLERTLRRDFEVDFFSGREAKIKCYGSFEGEKIWHGRLIETTEENIIIESEDEKIKIPKTAVASIKLDFDADAALKSGGSGDDG